MEELVRRVMRTANVDAEAAQRVIEVELAFLKDQGPDEKVEEMLRRIPGGAAVPTPEEGSFGGMMGAMSAFSTLRSLGLDMTEIRNATKELLAFAKQHAGEELVDDIVASIPLLNQVT